jgi:hypothetical protein
MAGTDIFGGDMPSGDISTHDFLWEIIRNARSASHFLADASNGIASDPAMSVMGSLGLLRKATSDMEALVADLTRLGRLD